MIVRTVYAADNATILDQTTHSDDWSMVVTAWFRAINPAVRVTFDMLDGTSVVLTYTAD